MKDKCQAGCKYFTGGEVYHHEDCVFYPESMSKMYDDLIARMRAINNDKLHQKKQIVCAVLGISDVEYDNVIIKTTHIKKLGGSMYLFLENGFKLKKVRLHSNSVHLLCELLNIELS